MIPLMSSDPRARDAYPRPVIIDPETEPRRRPEHDTEKAAESASKLRGKLLKFK